MGHPKALLPLESGPFLVHILKTVQKTGLGKPVVVLGRSASIIESAVNLQHADVLVNAKPERGQLSSIRLAMNALGTGCIGAMIWPVDQPLVSVKLVKDLAHLFFTSNALIANPVCGNKQGHPVIFRRDLFREFMAEPLSKGPKGILVRHEGETAALATDETGTVFDIDTPADYAYVCGRTLDSVLK